MAKSSEIVVVEEQQPTTKNNLFPWLPNLKFEFQRPFFNPKPKNKAVVGDQKKQEEQEAETKPNVVRFPKTQVVVPPPLETQAEAQGSNKTSNPVIHWQVYALGAFFISRWIWARWNERKARGRSPNDGEGRPSDDGPRSSENE